MVASHFKRWLLPERVGQLVWVEFRPCDEASAKVCVGGRSARHFDPDLDDLLSVVDGANDSSRRLPTYRQLHA